VKASATLSVSVAAALGLALLVAAGAAGRSEASAITLTSMLDAAQEVPQPTGNVAGARGTFLARAERTATGASLTWRLAFTGLTGQAVAAHVHTGARGQAGPVSVPLCGPCTSPATGTVDIQASLVSAIESGNAYVNVHTQANASGEIRGQVAVVAAAQAKLKAREEVPRPKGRVARATGTFAANVTKTGASGKITWWLSFSRLTGRAVAAHIHAGPRGKAGPVLLALCGPCRSGARGSATARVALLSALERGRAYVDVHTARNPGGEIRGQIPPVPLRVSIP
jgi:CHRD domain